MINLNSMFIPNQAASNDFEFKNDHSRCLAKNTRVLMGDNSKKNIQDISIGDQVKNEQLRSVSVTDICTGNERSLILMSLADGSILEATGDHPVQTENGLKPIKKLRIGEMVQGVAGLQAVQDLQIIDYNNTVYNLILNCESHLMICEGIIVGDFFAQTLSNRKNT